MMVFFCCLVSVWCDKYFCFLFFCGKRKMEEVLFLLIYLWFHDAKGKYGAVYPIRGEGKGVADSGDAEFVGANLVDC